MHSSQEVVLLIVQHIVGEGHTWCHQFRDASLDEFLGELGVFKLVADGHTLTSPDEFWQIGIEGVMGETCHLVALVVTVVPVCQRDTKNLRSRYSILAVGLVEVTTTEQEHRIRVLRLQIEELLHHRGEFTVFLCLLYFSFF